MSPRVQVSKMARLGACLSGHFSSIRGNCSGPEVWLEIGLEFGLGLGLVSGQANGILEPHSKYKHAL